MDPTTSTPETNPDGSTIVQAEAPKKARTKPRKLTMTDKILEARAISANKVDRLHKRADQLRGELAKVVKELNEEREQIAVADASLPPHLRTAARGEQVEAERASHVVNGQAEAHP